MLVCIDPGLRACGVSAFHQTELKWCGYVKSPEKKERGPKAWRAMADEVKKALYYKNLEVTALIMEQPQVYQQKFWKGDPNDLIELAGVLGCLTYNLYSPEVHVVLPRQWKKQCPKEIHNARILSKLTEDEKKLLEGMAQSTIHNVIDSVGIGLFQTGRYVP
jgi:hypothetical protein